MRVTGFKDRKGIRPRFCGSQDGQALVELALTVPVLFLLVLGVVELARVGYTTIELANAAKAAAQFAAQNMDTMPSSTASNNGAITTAAQNDAPELTGMVVSATGGYGCSDGSAVTNSSGVYSCSTGSLVRVAQITTTVNYDPLIHLPFLPSTYNLTGYAAQECGDCL